MDELLLISGNDIPFPYAQVSIHQPRLREIAYIGEENFYNGCEMLTFSKSILSESDRVNLEHQSDFEILMSMVNSGSAEIRKQKISMKFLLSLLFPEYNVLLWNNEIALKKEDKIYSINSENFEKFKEIITAIFCLKQRKQDDAPEYNPSGDLARKIAEKLKKGRETVQKSKPPQKIAILSRYISILSVGEGKDINELLDYTVYQLMDEFQRFELKEEFDIYLKAKMAGARDLKEVDNWKKDIHP